MRVMRVVLFQEHDFWFAQGLEHDICVRGKTIKEVKINFQIAVRLESEEGLDRISPAPKRFHDMWDIKSGDLVSKDSESSGIEYGIAA